MKVVAVSQRIDLYPERNEARDALDQRLIVFLLTAGFVPMPVPNCLYKERSDGRHDHKAIDSWMAAVTPLAIVLSGGNDIGQCFSRDLTEGWLLDHSNRQRLPVLGICRGMQMMAHWSGTGLRPVEGHVRSEHRVSGAIVGEVNSYHDFSVESCPEGFEVLAHSEDGEIEAVRHQSLPWEGWMWHPERNEKFEQQDLERIKNLFGG